MSTKRVMFPVLWLQPRSQWLNIFLISEFFWRKQETHVKVCVSLFLDQPVLIAEKFQTFLTAAVSPNFKVDLKNKIY